MSIIDIGDIGDVVEKFVPATFCFFVYNYKDGACVLFINVVEGPISPYFDYPF